MTGELPTHLKKVLPQEVWDSWSAEQQAYILAQEGQPAGDPRYADKCWELDRHRPEYRETCDKCYFEYCFYAMPRNWSLDSSADVWNLMKCANVKCQNHFESCL
jgi:hypothetical protein